MESDLNAHKVSTMTKTRLNVKQDSRIDMRVVMAEAANASEQKMAGPIRPTKAGHDVFDAFKVQSKRSVRPDGFVESSSPSRVSSSPWKAKAQPEPPTSSVKGMAFPKLSANTLPRQKSQPKLINVPTPSTTSQPTPVVMRPASSYVHPVLCED